MSSKPTPPSSMLTSKSGDNRNQSNSSSSDDDRFMSTHGRNANTTDLQSSSSRLSSASPSSLSKSTSSSSSSPSPRRKSTNSQKKVSMMSIVGDIENQQEDSKMDSSTTATDSMSDDDSTSTSDWTSDFEQLAALPENEDLRDAEVRRNAIDSHHQERSNNDNMSVIISGAGGDVEPRQQLHRYRNVFAKNVDDSELAVPPPQGSSSPPSSVIHHHHRTSRSPSTSPSSMMFQRLFSSLVRPFYKTSKRKRKHRGPGSKSLVSLSSSTGDSPQYRPLLEKVSSSSVSSSSSPNGSHHSSLSATIKLLLRRARLPLAVFCFVFLFVIQFRANTNYTTSIASSGALVAPQLNLPDSSATLPNNMSNNKSPSLSSSSSISTLFSPTAAEIVVFSNLSLSRDVGSNEIVPPLYSNSSLDHVIQLNSSYNETSSDKMIGALLMLNNLTELETNSSAPPCPLVPPKLVGRLKVLRTPPPMAEMETTLSEVHVGGRYFPPDCKPAFRVAIIVPYRDRDEHLRTFLWNIHPMLMRQNIDYGIYIVEQAGQDRFNRAKLMNIGFLEALKQHNYDCFIFHDVDLIPEDDRNLYTCPEQPRHMSVAIDKFRYRLPYKDLFGGVSALTRQQFETVNGFSNEFWGWGGEDDDMSNRVRHYKFKISRYSADVARYTMLKHEQDAPSTDRYKKLYNGWRRFKSDGINSTKYQVLDVSFKKLYTWLLVDVFPPSIAKHKSRRHLAVPSQVSGGGVRSRLFPTPSKSHSPYYYKYYHHRHF